MKLSRMASDKMDDSTKWSLLCDGRTSAECERELTKERTAFKRAASRASGAKFGRPRMVDDAEYIATARRISCGCRTQTALTPV